MASLDLYYREYGATGHAHAPVIMVHGLFGSAANWHSIARRFEGNYRLIVPDLRNHGRSPHAANMDYPTMAADLVQLLDKLGIAQAAIIGHSMGAKVAMWMALNRADRIARMMAVDMAPVRYANRFDPIFSAIHSIATEQLQSRSEGEQLMTKQLGNPALVRFLLQNLALEQGRFSWRINVSAIERAIESILDFPRAADTQQFPGKAWFVHGSESDYIAARHNVEIRRLFPFARLHRVSGAGHWVYAERPEEFSAILKRFIAA